MQFDVNTPFKSVFRAHSHEKYFALILLIVLALNGLVVVVMVYVKHLFIYVAMLSWIFLNVSFLNLSCENQRYVR